MTDRQAAEAREPLTEDAYDAEWERLYAILGNGDRDSISFCAKPLSRTARRASTRTSSTQPWLTVSGQEEPK